ncbi:hypothetical protein DFH08DRAFT_14836 [Mycena albidolilacea]|uniref:Uncharacterized protein n=1 Tax=Mycena albidolilacea TaxID=1033008 RepID=A0AAD7F4D2_9AGAR|nr:hypothetical protein DFH08DRAFT_14836 [Mycena albidolilacea]
MSTELLTSLHVSYIQNPGKSTDDLAYNLTAYLRLNAIYWDLTALFTMGHPEARDKACVISFVESCWDERAGTFTSSDFALAHLSRADSAPTPAMTHTSIPHSARYKYWLCTTRWTS